MANDDQVVNEGQDCEAFRAFLTSFAEAQGNAESIADASKIWRDYQDGLGRPLDLNNFRYDSLDLTTQVKIMRADLEGITIGTHERAANLENADLSLLNLDNLRIYSDNVKGAKISIPKGAYKNLLKSETSIYPKNDPAEFPNEFVEGLEGEFQQVKAFHLFTNQYLQDNGPGIIVGKDNQKEWRDNFFDNLPIISREQRVLYYDGKPIVDLVIDNRNQVNVLKPKNVGEKLSGTFGQYAQDAISIRPLLNDGFIQPGDIGLDRKDIRIAQQTLNLLPASMN